MAGPLWIRGRAYAVSVPELAHAGINLAQLDTAILESGPSLNDPASTDAPGSRDGSLRPHRATGREI